MLSGNDVIGDAYEYLIAHFASDAEKKVASFLLQVLSQHFLPS
jgi:type I restriction enzyme M protein